MQGNSSVIATVVVGLVIVGAVAYGIYSTNSGLSALSEQNTSLKGQIASLNQQVSSVNQQVSTINEHESSLSEQNSNLASQIAGLNQQNVGLNQQLSNLQQQVSTLEQRTLTVVTVSNTVVYVQTTSVTTTATVTSISAVPQSTLLIIGDTYDNTSQTFQFTVQNTQNFTVYAQLSATLWGTSCMYYNQQGSYLSQVYTFKPLSNTVTTLDLNLGSYQSNGLCGHTAIVYFTMSYVAAASTQVSQTYTFNVVPPYTWS